MQKNYKYCFQKKKNVSNMVNCFPIATNPTYAPSNRHHTSYASYYSQGLGYCNLQGVDPSSLVVKSIKAIFAEMFYLEFDSPLLELYEIKSAVCSLVFYFRLFSKNFTSGPSKKYWPVFCLCISHLIMIFLHICLDLGLQEAFCFHPCTQGSCTCWME